MSVSGKSKGGNKRNQSPRGRERGMMRRSETENTMKKKTEKQTGGDELGRECDLSKLKGGVRGKYIARIGLFLHDTTLVWPLIVKPAKPDEQSGTVPQRSVGELTPTCLSLYQQYPSGVNPQSEALPDEQPSN